MTGPTQAAYEAAAQVEIGAPDSVHPPWEPKAYAAMVTRVAGRNWKLRAVVRAVWAEARTQVAAEIRASVRVPGEAVGPARLMFAEWAARIAEGDQP